MQQSAGTLLYRNGPHGWEVLIVHPSGDYNRRKPWSIPKGVPDPGEDLEAAARRETREEAGIEPGSLVYLGFSDYQKSGKRIHCYAGPAPQDEPAPASWEIDQARFVPLDEAWTMLHPDQRVFLERLKEYLELV